MSYFAKKKVFLTFEDIPFIKMLCVPFTQNQPAIELQGQLKRMKEKGVSVVWSLHSLLRAGLSLHMFPNVAVDIIS